MRRHAGIGPLRLNPKADRAPAPLERLPGAYSSRPYEAGFDVRGAQGSTGEHRAAQEGDHKGAQEMDMKLEVVVIPVADVDRAKGFYTALGWRLDADVATNK